MEILQKFTDRYKMSCYTRKMSIGKITIFSGEKGISRLCFGEYAEIDADYEETSAIKDAFLQLGEYLNGVRKKFDLHLKIFGTDFQILVWDQLKKIPYGKTKAYKELAHSIGNPQSSMAVGKACGKNPIPIFIPCHRVIGHDGSLVGYAGGLGLKRQLLKIEGHGQ